MLFEGTRSLTPVDPWAVPSTPPLGIVSGTADTAAIGNGQVVLPHNLDLALIKYGGTRYLGYQQLATGMLPGANTVVLSTNGSQFTWLDGELRAGRTVPDEVIAPCALLRRKASRHNSQVHTLRLPPDELSLQRLLGAHVLREDDHSIDAFAGHAATRVGSPLAPRAEPRRTGGTSSATGVRTHHPAPARRSRQVV